MPSATSWPISLSNDIVVRPLTSTDVPSVRQLHSDLLLLDYPTSFFLQVLLLPARIGLVACLRSKLDEPIAFITASLQQTPQSDPPQLVPSTKTLASPRFRSLPGCNTDESRVEILTIGVLPEYQSHGLARLLVQHTLERFHELQTPVKAKQPPKGTVVHAHVSTTNTPALQFYEHLGMRIASEAIRNLYRTPCHGSRDAYVVVGRVN
ncbi:acyl-CoA N-acyltransferase [Infundibulicybe gibba]|nr:acyl-CoA N-acyltransferase [Infundibulicybe gibba]